jgi:single-strand DNA-binding protein
MASRSVNKAILIGHLGRDAETKFTPGGTAVTKFSVATSRQTKDPQSGEWKEETDWTNIVVWKAENLANYLTKGARVYVEGRIHSRSYDDKDGKKVYATEVVAFASDIILLGGKGDSAGSGRGGDEFSQAPVSMPRSAQGAAAPRQQAPQDDYGQGITDDDGPF